MQVRQIQVANDSVQDRLILRIGTHANEEIRVFITRRFLRELWPHLAGMLAGHLANPQPPATTADPDNAAGGTTSFDQAFQSDNPIYPLGANPLLASEATLEASGDQLARLTLREGRERSFNLNLNAELMQALCAMLRAASDQAVWDLKLEYLPAPAISRTAPPPPPRGSKLLH